MKLLIFLLLLLPAAVLAQTGSVDSTLRSASISRPLPPSMLQELRRSQKGRTLIYRDTVHASDLEHAHANDTTERAFSDSAFALVDTAVSLSHKEWLDSELVEIPELARFGNRVHFNYPAAIMTESEMTQVPFDSTILERMNPVTREVLPFFDQSPIPMSMPMPEPFEAFLEVGGGNIDQPAIYGFIKQAFDERMSYDASGDFVERPSLPLHTFLSLDGAFHASLGTDPALLTRHASELDATLGIENRALTLISDSLGSRSMNHDMALLKAGITLHGEATELLQYQLHLADCEWSEDLTENPSESSQYFALGLGSTIASAFQVRAGLAYSRASLNTDGLVESEDGSVLFGTKTNSEFAWDAGIKLLSGTGGGTPLSPVAHLRIALNPRWEFGGSFDPQAQLSSMATLTAIDPFYAQSSGRGAVIDKLNLAAFMNYAISADDVLRLEARVITRDHEPVFMAFRLRDSSILVTARQASTRREEFGASGNFLLFDRDILTASLKLTSATDLDSDIAMPFEPILKFEATYRFNSLWETFKPSLRFHSITLPDRTLGMIDFELRAQLTPALAGILQIENILNGASDFWPGYIESPRSVTVNARYAF
ncbi:MAG: hypothetical protein Q8922_10920 [Bacteroidota bacterium]|nr:hypothetical protein [Bacteroidota bacterium]MDP4232642.1 hypothetical protein [Bacteroidota bacterium]MDP4243894.1 hypothetical protein [Bacteroidota bacterium]MDP4288437.1 hypothetical protein [Bacteroidota bacterium]